MVYASGMSWVRGYGRNPRLEYNGGLFVPPSYSYLGDAKMKEYADGSEAFRLRQEFKEFNEAEGPSDDDIDNVVPVETPAIEFGDFILVGHGEVTNENCGVFRSHWGCLRVDLHNRVKMVKVYDREKKKDVVVSTVGKGYVRKVFRSCDKPSCPICYKYGWAGRQARKVELRLAELSKGYVDSKGNKHSGLGQVEHIVVTFPKKFWVLGYEVLKNKCSKVLSNRDVIGGFAIFHGFRYNLRQYWYWSPHWHVLGFLRGGYKCRSCKKIEKTGKCGIENRNCDGFVNRNYREFEKDGCIVKVKGLRKTVRGTARYLLDHSCIRKGVKRPHAGVWFGVCSYRKAKIKVEKKGCTCPICKCELVKLRNFGGDDFDGHEGFVRVFDEHGNPLWVEDERGSGSYERGA